MSFLKKLAGETLIYGLSSILGRMLYFLLTPLHTSVLNKSEYGQITELFSYSAFLIVFFTLRLEMAYFRYASDKDSPSKTFGTVLHSVTFIALLLGGILWLGAEPIADYFHIRNSTYIKLIAAILTMDALAEIPMSQFRLQGKAKKFASIRFANILTNFGLNIFFLVVCPRIESLNWFSKDNGVFYVLISNVIASAVSLILLIPQYKVGWAEMDKAYLKKMLKYSLPLVVVGLAGIINETFDRAIFKWYSPHNLLQNESLLGEYGAGYKLTMILSLFTQAFRMGAEPFFFKNKNEENARQIYADVTRYFTMVACIGMLATLLYITPLKIILIHPKFWEGMKVVPVLLFANLFLGIYYNVSVWYRLSDKTMYGLYISVLGAAVTILLNIWWIPKISYMGCAWATFSCYAFMVMLCYYWGQRQFPIPYPIKRISIFIVLALVIYAVSTLFSFQKLIYSLIFNTLLFALYILSIWKLEGQRLKQLVLNR